MKNYKSKKNKNLCEMSFLNEDRKFKIVKVVINGKKKKFVQTKEGTLLILPFKPIKKTNFIFEVEPLSY